uniref:Blasticidin M n=1 Tax=Streptomyces griseochromogenes TaxID=68214 RepID=UPI000D671F7E|nr:Chain A, Blasticidin M [Streptomyces griseochromogenes]5VTO_B Chain B, Blasticidin M [Streptomyces griseochromogenes]
KAGVRSVFLAGPFMGLVNPETNSMPSAEQLPFLTLIEHFEKQGLEVFNAHRREAWGAQVLTPEECTPLDQLEIRKADVFVAIPGIPPSPGTHVEIGWASAFDKPIVLLLEEGREEEYGFLVRGLGTVAAVEFVHYKDIALAKPQIDAAIRKVVDRVNNPAATP